MNLVLVGASPIGHSNVSCRRRPTGRSHCSQKAGSVGSNPTGGTSLTTCPRPEDGTRRGERRRSWFESYRWHDTSGCSSAVRARGRGPRGRWCDSSHSDLAWSSPRSFLQRPLGGRAAHNRADEGSILSAATTRHARLRRPTEESAVSNTVACGFESRRGHDTTSCGARLLVKATASKPVPAGFDPLAPCHWFHRSDLREDAGPITLPRRVRLPPLQPGRRRPTGRSHCSEKAGSAGSNPAGGTLNPICPRDFARAGERNEVT